MTNRIATLNATQLIQLDALRDVLNLPYVAELLGHEESLDLFYGSLLQASVNKLEIDAPQFDDMKPRAKFLKNRVTWRKGKEWGEIFVVVNEVFSRHVPKSRSGEDQNLGIKLFLIDLLYALVRRKPVIRVINHRDLPDRITRLPTPLRIPIQNLFNCVESVEATVVSQIQSIRETDVELFQEILASKLFENYQSASSTFEDSCTNIEKARQFVEKAAVKLCERNKILLRLQRTPVALLSISEKIIEATFGSLSGKIAGVATELGKEYLVGHGRVVLYDCSKMVSSVIKSRFEEYGRSNRKP